MFRLALLALAVLAVPTRATATASTDAIRLFHNSFSPGACRAEQGSSQEAARVPLRGAFPGSAPLIDFTESGAVRRVNGGVAMVTMPPRSGAVLVR